MQIPFTTSLHTCHPQAPLPGKAIGPPVPAKATVGQRQGNAQCVGGAMAKQMTSVRGDLLVSGLTSPP